MAIDWKKLGTPEGRRKAREAHKQFEKEEETRQKELHRKLEILVNVVDLLPPWERGFIGNVEQGRKYLGFIALTDKQEKVLNRIFKEFVEDCNE